MPLDLSRPVDLFIALGPDLLLFAGAMILMLVSALRRESAAHQRSVGVASIVVAVITLAAVVYAGAQGFKAPTGAVAVDGFRWAADVIFLVGAIIAIALS